MVTETDLAWLAGFFDGEGTIFAQIYEGNLSVLWTVANTDLPSIRRVRHIVWAVCGRKYKITEIKGQKGRKPVFRVQVRHKRRLFSLLSRLIPYFTTKLQRAQLALALVTQNHRAGSKKSPLQDWELSYAEQIKQMNGPNNYRTYLERSRDCTVQAEGEDTVQAPTKVAG